MSWESFESQQTREIPVRMPPPNPVPAQGGDLPALVRAAILRGEEFLFSAQRTEGHWCAELESNPTITAEYVFLAQMLGLDLSRKKKALVRYLLGQQNQDGGWGIARLWHSDVSTAAEVYLALRLLGVEASEPSLRRAEKYILGAGGIEKVRVFTRIFFAMFGLMPWENVPSIPPEFIFLPPQIPVNIYSLSSWARGTMIPLFVIYHHQPVYALPNGRSAAAAGAANDWLDHLWRNPAQKRLPYSPPLPSLVLRHGISWTSFFGLGDWLMKVYERARVPAIRNHALERCTRWIRDRQEPTGDWAGIFPPMLNGVIALTLQGYGLDSEEVAGGLAAIEKFAWEDEEGLRIQACVSPVWDTVLCAIALVDSGTPPGDPRLERALEWVIERQLLVEHGDWRVYRPTLPAGGWSFEYYNSWYPDVDDTAACLIALLKQKSARVWSDTVKKALAWMLGMQNRDGGWAAFDVNNDKLFLHRIPFSDMDSLCDPSSPDVTGRVLEALGLWGELARRGRKGGKHEIARLKLRHQAARAIRRGIAYLRRTQEDQGSWFGRWGVNYIYGTSNALCGLVRAGVPADDPMVRSALRWLKQVQNPDGGWGESLASYADASLMGQGVSSPSQTAWALMGLLAYESAEEPAIERGVRWLVERQAPPKPSKAWEGGEAVPAARGASWEEAAFTGTGFPNHFYLRYHYYRHYFPMMALGRYRRALTN